MAVIEIPWEEHKKVFDELVEYGPVTYLPGNLLTVRQAHLRFLDERGIPYTVHDWKEVAARRTAGVAQKT